MLTKLESGLSFIKSGDHLQIIGIHNKLTNLVPPEKNTLGSLSSQDSGILADKEFMQGSKLCLEDFELIKVIGKGGFSKVF